MRKIRLGMMGFGQIGRQIYTAALASEDFDVVAISDIGQPEILHYLLTSGKVLNETKLEGNYLVCGTTRTRLLPADSPSQIPWDAFGVDLVIEASGRFRSREELEPHLENGANRVVLSALPVGEIDRVILYGVNQDSAEEVDQIISAGSASTTATALVLKHLAEAFTLKQASMTSVHAYTSDQSLQDYAGVDYRRSRSGARNIIPNMTPALEWIQTILPEVDGKFSAYALNVPVQTGSMLDITAVLGEESVGIDEVNQIFFDAANKTPELIRVISDPIVSSDVKGIPQSLLVDSLGTMKAGKNMVKIIGWHESLGHAHRILDVVRTYADLSLVHLKEAS